MYNLAGQVLPTSGDITKATQDYYNRMQQLVAPQREQQLAATRQGVFNTGRAGLATGATQAGGMLATNPEMAAYYNAIAQQDLNLANQAETQARANLQTDITTAGKLYGGGAAGYTTASDLQNAMYRNVAASQNPFATGMAATTGLETTAQTPIAQGFQYGAPVTAAEQYAGDKLFAGATGAAQVAGQYAPAIANYQYQNSAYSPWGTLLQGMGGSLGQSNLGSWSSLFGNSGTSGGTSGGMTMPGTTNWTSSSSQINPYQYFRQG